MTKKFSELGNINQDLAATDIFAVVDTSETSSKRVTLADLSASVFSATSAATIIENVLNAYAAGAGYGNGLKSGYLWHNEATTSEGASAPAYKPGSYYLDYNNFTNAPGSKTDLKEFANSGLFLRLADSKIKYSEGANLGGILQLITTDNIDEGTANLYYTVTRDQDHLEKNFETQYNIYSGGLVGSNRDSLEAQVATFQSIVSSQSKTLRFASGNKDSYIKGQILRIYGASQTAALLDISTISNLTFAIQANNFTSSAAAAATFTEMNYKFALFDTITGKISAPSAEFKVFVKSSDSDISFLDAFNSDVNIKISYTNVPANNGVLVYRKYSTDANHNLIAVLGEKEREEGFWFDYMAFDYVSWSGKNSTYNNYTSIPHFPLTIAALTTAKRGWVDVTIDAVTEIAGSGFDVTLTEDVYVNVTGSAEVYHNDTALIQNAIDNNSISGKKGVILNPRPYNVTGITVPNNFGISGTRSVSKISKLPWSGGAVDRSSIIRSSAATAAQISLVGFDIEGNSPYQFLFSDSSATNLNANYALDFGTGANSITLDGVRVNNVSSGGLWAEAAVDLSVRSGEFINSGFSDRNRYSPISSSGSTTTFITGNKIKNYSEYVDVSTTTQGVVTDNIVQNCGSGIFVYGSTFFLSSSNVLIGPAGEFLPSADTLNSAYDSINVNLTANGNSLYNSDSMVYQENGTAFNLTTTSITNQNPELIYRVFYIKKSAEGVEEAYGTGTTAGNFIPGIRYMITDLGIASPGGSTQIAAAQGIWNTAAGTSNVIYEVGDSFKAQAAGTGTGKATSGGVDAIQFTDEAGTFRELGEFKFQISASLVNNIITSGGTYSYTTLKAATATHTGIAWTASHRNFVKAGALGGPGTWTTPSGNDLARYAVAVTDQKYLTVGKTVTIDNHGNFRNRAPNATQQLSGKVTSIANNNVEIDFKGTNIGASSNNANLVPGTGSIGTLNIVDEFILAKGRII